MGTSSATRKGRLPFDLRDQQVFEVENKADFDAIKDFLF
jgi:hypothetical protein